MLPLAGEPCCCIRTRGRNRILYAINDDVLCPLAVHSMVASDFGELSVGLGGGTRGGRNGQGRVGGGRERDGMIQSFPLGWARTSFPSSLFPTFHGSMLCRRVSLCKTVEIPSPHPKKSSTQLNSTRCLQVINDGKEVSVEWDAPTGKEPAKIATGLDGSFMLVMRSHSFQDASVYRFVACLVARDGLRSSLLLTFLILLLLLLLPRFAASFTFYSAPSHDREAPNCSMYTHICAHL